jgi:AraC-like DNA-binding protein
MLEFLDTIARYSAIGLFCWMSTILLYHACGRLQATLGSISAFTTAIYLITSDPNTWSVLGENARWLVVISMYHSTAIWLFVISLFDDKLKLGRLHYAAIAIAVFAGLSFPLKVSLDPIIGDDVSIVLWIIYKFALLFHMLYVAWEGRHNDLIERRRQFRTMLLWTVVIVSLSILIAELWLLGLGYGQELKLLQSVSFLVIAFAILSRISLLEADAFFMPAPSKKLAVDDPAVTELCRPEDTHNLAILSQLMDEGTYMEPGLTIAGLADKANMPEHRLRHLINKHMGYRNFADYLNFHRIEAAKARLSNIHERHVPVLTIAMELGYQSLGPFNRAFKERTEVTPTTYRRDHLKSTGVDMAVGAK